MLLDKLISVLCSSCPWVVIFSAGALLADTYQNPVGPRATYDEPLNGNYAVGFQFDLSEPTSFSSVGGVFTTLNGTMFIAIVDQSSLVFEPPTNSETALPFEREEAAAFTIVQGTKLADTPPEEFSFPLSVTLQPGSYVFVVGTGLYGTSGHLVVPLHEPGALGNSFRWLRWDGWASIGGGATHDLFLSGSADIRYPVGSAVLKGSSGLGGQFLGARFSIAEAVRVTSVAAEFSSTAGTFFAAFVPLDSLNSLPMGDPQSGTPFNPEKVLAHQVFSANIAAPQVLTVPFSVELTPGVYGLVFGSGLYGTDGRGGMPTYQAIDGSSSFFWSDSPWRWQDFVLPSSSFSSDALNISFEAVGAAPWLKIIRQGDTVLLSWPVWAKTFSLQTRDDLRQTNTWEAVGLVPTVFGDQAVVALPMDRPSKFFRLQDVQ